MVARQEHIQKQQADKEFGLQEEVEEGASAREAQPDGGDENAERREGDQDAAPRSPERQLTESRRDKGQERRDRRGSGVTSDGFVRSACACLLLIGRAERRHSRGHASRFGRAAAGRIMPDSIGPSGRWAS
jgi:hypothetical protein